MWNPRRTLNRTRRFYREARMVGMALKSSRHPVLAHVVVIRRCNLACTYCNEYDTFSKPIPVSELIRRIDRLAELGTTVVTLTGGEPLMHPDLEQVIRRIRHHGMIAVSVTNGYLLSKDRIKKLNQAGLERLQISVDNIKPDDVSMKSLKVLDQKLRWLSEYAEFEVNIHTVVGACTEHPEDAVTIAKRAKELGLVSTAGIVHDDAGQLRPLNPEQQKAMDELERLSRPLFSFARHNPWRHNLARGLPNDWHCGAGGRHLYICENGLVHYCMAQRGYPAIPLEQYTQADIDREAKTPKSCAPYCTIFCIQRIAFLDRLRQKPAEALVQLFPAAENGGKAQIPLPVRMLIAMLGPSRPGYGTNLVRKTASRLLRIN